MKFRNQCDKTISKLVLYANAAHVKVADGGSQQINLIFVLHENNKPRSQAGHPKNATCGV